MLFNKTVRINKIYFKLEEKDIITDPKIPCSNRIIHLSDFILDILNEYSNTLYDYDSFQGLFNITKYYLIHKMIRDNKIIQVRDL